MYTVSFCGLPLAYFKCNISPDMAKDGSWDPQRYLHESLDDLQMITVTVIGRELGRGSYGVVREIECNGTMCAAKQLHDVFFEGTKVNYKKLVIERFVTECRFHSRQRHPNIVQLLGVYFQPKSVLPMLVMELMETSLQRFLDEYDCIPITVRNRILLDVSLGLLHLHSQSVVHRDLTAGNVLLTSALTAKITDLGMARIIDQQVVKLQQQSYLLTAMPGTQAAMAPEACTRNPVYNYKLDVFSFGVLALQVYTQVFPVPDEALYRTDSSQPTGRITLTAIERRKTYIDTLDRNSPIYSLVLRCLSDDPDMRPTTSSVVQEIKILTKSAPAPSTNTIQLISKLSVAKKEVEQLKKALKEEKQLLADCKKQLKLKEEELLKQTNTVESLSRSNNVLHKMITPKVKMRDNSFSKRRTASTRNPRANEPVETIQSANPETRKSCDSSSVVSQQDKALPEKPRVHSSVHRNRDWKVWDIDGESLIDITPVIIVDKELDSPMNINIETCSSLPIPVYNAQAVLLRGSVYIGGFKSNPSNMSDIYQYTPSEDKWKLYSTAPTSLFGLAVFRNQLTVIGGLQPHSNVCSSSVQSLKERDGSEKVWEPLRQGMSCGRSACIALGFASHLAIAGGLNNDGKTVNIVEIYQAESGQWYSVLPPSPWQGKAHFSAMFARACWYIMGGEGGEGATDEVHAFPLTLLLDKLSKGHSHLRTSPWTKLPQATNSYSAIAYINGTLLTIGGRSVTNHTPSKIIHSISQDENKWESAAILPQAVEKATSVTLSQKSVLVIGGVTGDLNKSPSASVYKLKI